MTNKYVNHNTLLHKLTPCYVKPRSYSFYSVAKSNTGTCRTKTSLLCWCNHIDVVAVSIQMSFRRRKQP